jgi:hypothetical protein
MPPLEGNFMLRINGEAPNFTAETSQGTINFQEWIGDGWAILTRMFSDARWIGGCCLMLIATLWGVGAVATPHPEPIRHFVQSLPIWAGVILGPRKSELTKWVAFPFFVFWLLLMTCI